MKILFLEIEQWEAEYVKNSLQLTAKDLQLEFSEQKLDKELALSLSKGNLPNDAEIISVFVGSKVDKEVIDEIIKGKNGK